MQLAALEQCPGFNGCPLSPVIYCLFHWNNSWALASGEVLFPALWPSQAVEELWGSRGGPYGVWGGEERLLVGDPLGAGMCLGAGYGGTQGECHPYMCRIQSTGDQ